VVVVQGIVGALCALAFVVVLVRIVQDRPGGNLVDALFAAIELGLLVQLVVGIVEVTDAPDGVSVPTYVGYLVGALVVPPVAWVWAQAERSRGGLAVLLVALVVVPFLFLRLHQVWSGQG
jgi:hypothetical protein